MFDENGNYTGINYSLANNNLNSVGAIGGANGGVSGLGFLDTGGDYDYLNQMKGKEKGSLMPSMDNIMDGMGLINSLAGLIGGYQTHGLFKDAMGVNIAQGKADLGEARDKYAYNAATRDNNAQVRNLTIG